MSERRWKMFCVPAERPMRGITRIFAEKGIIFVRQATELSNGAHPRYCYSGPASGEMAVGECVPP